MMEEGIAKTTLENSWVDSVNISVSYDPEILLLDLYPTHIYFHQKTYIKMVTAALFIIFPKLGTIQMGISNRIDL